MAVVTKRSAFPSPRQLKASGLNRRFYSPHVRELVDYDYDEDLPEEARVWLGAFTEEHYRGWRLKGETQLLDVEALRAADAARKRSQRARETLDPIVMITLDNIDLLSSDGATETELVTTIDRRRQRDRQVVALATAFISAPAQVRSRSIRRAAFAHLRGELAARRGPIWTYLRGTRAAAVACS